MKKFTGNETLDSKLKIMNSLVNDHVETLGLPSTYTDRKTEWSKGQDHGMLTGSSYVTNGSNYSPAFTIDFLKKSEGDNPASYRFEMFPGPRGVCPAEFYIPWNSTVIYEGKDGQVGELYDKIEKEIEKERKRTGL